MRHILAAAFVAIFAVPAHAQVRQVLPGGCGTAAYSQGVQPATMDTTGRGCETSLVSAPSQYPASAVPITASATGTTAATTATLAASATLKTYVCGFSILANATGAATGNATVAGTVTGTMNYTQWTAPAASGIGNISISFPVCVPSSAVNTAIVVTSAAPGAGGVVSVSAWGYQAP